MFAFFDQIGSLIGSVIDFIVNLFTNFVKFFQMIFTSLSFLVEICAALPLPVQGACLCVISVSVVYLIVGR